MPEFSDKAQEHIDKSHDAVDNNDSRTGVDELLAAYDEGTDADKANLRQAVHDLANKTKKKGQ